jgi:GNAT superfamily N-acetyltransferase
MEIIRPLPSEFAPAAARIFYDAFPLKVERLMIFPRSREQGLRIIEASIVPPTTLGAVADGELRGVCAYQDRDAPSMALTYRALRAEFGPWAAAWRAGMNLPDVWSNPALGTRRIEAVAVAGSARGKGVGSALLQEVEALARRDGMEALALEVVDTNPDAMRLYERLGFEPEGRVWMAPLTHAAGFDSFVNMRKML